MTAGLMPLEEGGRVDFARLRGSRRGRLFEAMDASDLDALLLGRPANIRFASGARQLWTAGARPFAPGCVVVRSTGEVHLLSVWDEGVPSDVSHDRLFGLSWDPANLAGALRRIPGLVDARRVGTDGLTPLFASLLADVIPRGEIVDGTAALWRARTQKDEDEIACIATATAAAEAGLSAMVDAATPGTSERELLAVLAGSLAALGLPPMATESVAFVSSGSPGSPGVRHLATDRRIEPGDLVVLNPGALYAGYEGGLGRTIAIGPPTDAQRALAARARDSHAGLLGACRAGSRGAEVLKRWPTALVVGLGLGVEPPVIGVGRGGEDEVVAGSVLAVQSWTAEPAVGGILLRDVVLIADDGPQLLSHFDVGL